MKGYVVFCDSKHNGDKDALLAVEDDHTGVEERLKSLGFSIIANPVLKDKSQPSDAIAVAIAMGYTK